MKGKQWIALALGLVLLLGGCSSMDVVYNESIGSMEYGSDMTNDVAQAQGRKLVLTASLSLETTQFDDAAALLEQHTGEFGGWIENSELQGSRRNDSARYG